MNIQGHTTSHNLEHKIQMKSPNPGKSISGSFLALIYLISISLYYLDKSETLKYFQYLLPVLGLIVSMQSMYKIWHTSGDLAKLCSVLLIISFINLCVILIKGDLYLKFFQEGFLFIGSLIFAITLIGNYTYFIPKLINNSLYILIGIFLIDKGTTLLSVLSNPSSLVIGVITSSVTTESSLSFYFAILSFYFIVEKDKGKAIWAILFMILSFKRIAFMGFLLSTLLLYGSYFLKVSYNRKLFSTFLTFVNFSYIWILILLVDGSFDETISSFFGVSSNFLFMGRVDLYSNIFSKLGYFNIFGIGIGKVSDFLGDYVDSGVSEGVLTNLHSDILKYYLELGTISFLIFMYKFVYYLSRNLITFCFMIMVNIIFLTDNVSIYFGFMVLFFLINYKLSLKNNLPVFQKSVRIIKVFQTAPENSQYIKTKNYVD